MLSARDGVSVRLQVRKGILGIGMPPSFGPSLHVIAKAGLDFYHLIRRNRSLFCLSSHDGMAGYQSSSIPPLIIQTIHNSRLILLSINVWLFLSSLGVAAVQ